MTIRIGEQGGTARQFMAAASASDQPRHVSAVSAEPNPTPGPHEVLRTTLLPAVGSEPARRRRGPGVAAVRAAVGRVEVIHVLLLLGVGAVVLRSGARTGGALGSEASVFALAVRLLDGAVPYRTLLPTLPPGAYAFDALVISILGRTIRAHRIAVLLWAAWLYPLAVYVAARTFVRRRGLALAASIGVILLLRPVPGARLFCALIALTLAARWLSSGRRAALPAAGIVAGFEFAFSLEAGLAVCIAIVTAIAIRAISARATGVGSAGLRPAAGFCVSVLVGLLPFVGAVAADGSLVTLARTVPNVLLTGDAWDLAAKGTPYRILAVVAFIPPLLTLLARATRVEVLRARALVGTLLAAWIALRLGPLATSPDADHLVEAVAELPLLAAWLVDWALDRRGRIRLPRGEVTLALGAGVLAAAGWRYAPGIPGYAGVWVLTAIIVAGLPTVTRPTSDRPRTGVRVVAILAVLTLVPLVATTDPGRLFRPLPAKGQFSGVRWEPGLAAQVRRATEVIRDSTPADRAAYVYPSGAALATLAGRRTSTSLPEIGQSPPDWHIRRLIDELAEAEPATVLVRYEQAAAGSRRLAPVTRWLEDRYVESTRLYGPELWAVWIRRDTPEDCRRLVLTPYERTSPDVVAVEAVAAGGGGRERVGLRQRGRSAVFSLPPRDSLVVRFTVDASSSDPGADRAVDIVGDGSTTRVWSGRATGEPQQVPLPALSRADAQIVLRSPGRTSTLWVEPVVCTAA